MQNISTGKTAMAKQPLAEVFGFPLANMGKDATRHRENRLCPFNNKVPNCTKDKANNPLGVCSILNDGEVIITCPVRFRQQWIIAEDAASFFFPKGTKWTTLTEVKLKDKRGVTIKKRRAHDPAKYGVLDQQAHYESLNDKALHPVDSDSALTNS